MNLLIPFNTEVEFNGPVKEICSISLEHEITQNDLEILGNFIVSGTYKEYEQSVNTLDFKYTLPFSVELTNRIDKDSLKFSIDNFTYEIENKKMNIKIDYLVEANELENRIEPQPIEILEELEDEISQIEVKKVDSEDIVDDSSVDEAIVTKSILPVTSEDEFSTFAIHVVKENETLESISSLYKIDKQTLCSINMIEEITLNTPLLIPLKDE